MGSTWKRDLSVSMSVYLSICLSVYLSACLFVSVCLSVSLSVYLSVCLPVCLSVCLPACLFVCLSVCLSPISLPSSTSARQTLLLNKNNMVWSLNWVTLVWSCAAVPQRRYAAPPIQDATKPWLAARRKSKPFRSPEKRTDAYLKLLRQPELHPSAKSSGSSPTCWAKEMSTSVVIGMPTLL